MPGPIRRLLPSVCVSAQVSRRMAPPIAMSLVTMTLVVMTLLVLAGCAPADPQAQVAAARADYEVKLSGWIVRQPEPMEPTLDPAATVESPMDENEGEVDPSMASETSPAEEEMAAVLDPVVPDSTEITVLFDVIVLFSGKDPLPGLTVDITHADSAGGEKVVRQHYLAVGNLHRGSTRQVAFELDGWDLADGDQFSIEVRQGLSDAERGTYREFQEAGSGPD